MADLCLVSDDTDRELMARAATGSLLEQLLCTAVLTLMNDVSRLKRRVADLEGRENV
jgi:hypothetical protein